jgi:hypothetical protein
VAEDRAGADDRHVEPAGGGPQAGPLGGQLGVTVGLGGRWHGGGQHRVGRRHAEHRARGRVHDLADAGVAARGQQGGRAVDVHRAQQFAVAGQRHLGDVVVDDVGAVDGHPHRDGVTDVGRDHVGAEVVGAGDLDVEQPHVVPTSDERVDEQPAEVAVAAGDDAGGGHSSRPWATHQRMLWRMPSSSATVGS